MERSEGRGARQKVGSLRTRPHVSRYFLIRSPERKK